MSEVLRKLFNKGVGEGLTSDDYVLAIQELEQKLKEAESVIEFYWDKCPINVMGNAFCGDNPSHQVAQDYFDKYKTNE
jgi:hypothetical protein